MSRDTSGQVERMLALRAFPGFSELDMSQLVVLAEIVTERFFHSGTALSTPGKPVTTVTLIRHGRVNVLRDGVPVRMFGAGDVVGGMAAITRDPVGQHIVAVDDVDAFQLEGEDMADVFEESFPVLHAVIRGLARGVLSVRKQMAPGAGYRPPEPPATGVSEPPGLVERILFLRGLLAYGKARVEALADLAREMEYVQVPAGTVFWQQEDASRYSLLILGGIVDCENADGQSFAFGPNSSVGGIDSLAGLPRWYGATARTEVTALRSDVENLLDVFEDHPDIGIEMLRVLARTLMALQARVDRQTLSSQGEKAAQ